MWSRRCATVFGRIQHQGPRSITSNVNEPGTIGPRPLFPLAPAAGGPSLTRAREVEPECCLLALARTCRDEPAGGVLIPRPVTLQSREHARGARDGAR